MSEKLIPKYAFGNIFRRLFDSDYANARNVYKEGETSYIDTNLKALTDIGISEKDARKQLSKAYDKNYKNAIDGGLYREIDRGDGVKQRQYLNNTEKAQWFTNNNNLSNTSSEEQTVQLEQPVQQEQLTERPNFLNIPDIRDSWRSQHFNNWNNTFQFQFPSISNNESPTVQPSDNSYTRKYSDFDYDAIRSWYSVGNRLKNYNEIMGSHFTNSNELTDEDIDKFADWQSTKNGLVRDGKAGNQSLNAFNNLSSSTPMPFKASGDIVNFGGVWRKPEKGKKFVPHSYVKVGDSIYRINSDYTATLTDYNSVGEGYFAEHMPSVYKIQKQYGLVENKDYSQYTYGYDWNKKK